MGLTHAKGTFTCNSKPSVKVHVTTTCIQKGFFFNLGGGFDTSAIPIGIPGGKPVRRVSYSTQIRRPAHLQAAKLGWALRATQGGVLAHSALELASVSASGAGVLFKPLHTSGQ